MTVVFTVGTLVMAFFAVRFAKANEAARNSLAEVRGNECPPICSCRGSF